MTANRIIITALAVLTLALTFSQWQLQRAVERLSARPAPFHAPEQDASAMEEKWREAEKRFEETKQQLDQAEARLAAAGTQIAQLDQRLRQVETGRLRRVTTDDVVVTTSEPKLVEEGGLEKPKRGWGPEQAAGPPDTFQAGDISTAWASQSPDGGDEWLKLDYERAVDISEVRVRETYNPGAITKVSAFLANGNEVTLWEGTEPPSQAPVEMSFSVPSSVNAKTVKIYLDTRRVAGWNEIDAVAIIGRDGTTQWAQHVTASSTYAAPRMVRGLERF